MTAISAVVASVVRGRGTLVLAEAGSGKSHLVTESLRVLARRSTRGDDPPITRWHAVDVPSGGARTGFEVLAQMLSLEELPQTLVEAARAVLDHLPAAGARPPVLCVEDVQLLDAGSALALAMLARRGDVVLVATGRPAVGATAPWHGLWRDDVLDRVDLAPLGLSEIESMLIGRLGGPVLGETVHRLWQESGGNAGHVHSLATDLRASGTLVRRDGVWALDGAATVAEETLRALDHVLDRLPPRDREAIELLSLLGPLTLSTFLGVVDREVVDDLRLRGLVRLTTSSSRTRLVVALPNEVYAQSVRRRIEPERRRQLLTGAMGVVGDGDAHMSHTVALMLDEGIRPNPVIVRDAVVDALARHRADEAVRIVDTVLADGVPAVPETVSLVLGRAQARRRTGPVDAVRADLGTARVLLEQIAAATPDDADLPGLVGALVLLEADVEHHDHDDLDGAVSILLDGTRWAARLTPTRASSDAVLQLEVSRLTRLGYAGRHREARAVAVLMLDTTTRTRLALPLVCPTSLGLLQAGRFDDVRRIMRRYQPVAAAHPGRLGESVTEIAIVGFLVRLWSGQVEALDTLIGTGLDLASSTTQWTVAQVSRGLIAAARGAWSAARHELHRANARISMDDRTGLASFGRAAEALAAAATGDVPAARALLDVLDTTPMGVTAGLEADMRLLRLDTLIWCHDPDALTMSEDLADWASRDGLARIELEALHRGMVLRRGNGAPMPESGLDRIRALARQIRSPRASTILRHVQALGSRDRDLLRIAERDLSRRGLWLPGSVQAPALTPREREVAALASAGLTSRSIATRLSLSVRTVDSHLASVFDKLGIRSRDELAGTLP